MSLGEDTIIKLLRKEKLSFEREKSFGDLKQGRFRFDFYVYLPNHSPIIVEYDGEQHFHFVSKFYSSRADFLKAQEHDRRKNSYCLANDIDLYRIPYWELSNIQTFNDCVQKKFKVTNRWWNDDLVEPKLK